MPENDMLILNIVADYFRVDLDNLLGNKSRETHIIRRRFIAIYLIRTQNNTTYKQIARYFNKDHSTVISNFNTAYNYIFTNEPSFTKDYNKILKIVLNNQ
jgi:chromosomal replication initiation ATPase DnaA